MMARELRGNYDLFGNNVPESSECAAVEKVRRFFGVASGTNR